MTGVGQATETTGRWKVYAQLSSWDQEGDAQIHFYRLNRLALTLPAYRFPAGWRCGAINDSKVPDTAKRAARKALRRLV